MYNDKALHTLFDWSRQCPHQQSTTASVLIGSRETPHPDQELHRQMNLLLSRLDEQQRRWYVAVESKRIGAGGDRLLSQITGLDEKTIQRGRQELAGSLAERPSKRARRPSSQAERLPQFWNGLQTVAQAHRKTREPGHSPPF